MLIISRADTRLSPPFRGLRKKCLQQLPLFSFRFFWLLFFRRFKSIGHEVLILDHSENSRNGCKRISNTSHITFFSFSMPYLSHCCHFCPIDDNIYLMPIIYFMRRVYFYHRLHKDSSLDMQSFVFCSN